LNPNDSKSRTENKIKFDENSKEKSNMSDIDKNSFVDISYEPLAMKKIQFSFKSIICRRRLRIAN